MRERQTETKSILQKHDRKNIILLPIGYINSLIGNNILFSECDFNSVYPAEKINNNILFPECDLICVNPAEKS